MSTSTHGFAAEDEPEEKAEPRPGDEKAYEGSWYQVLRARREAAEEDAAADDGQADA
jgi:hypothetical protein